MVHFRSPDRRGPGLRGGPLAGAAAAEGLGQARPPWGWVGGGLGVGWGWVGGGLGVDGGGWRRMGLDLMVWMGLDGSFS